MRRYSSSTTAPIYGAGISCDRSSDFGIAVATAASAASAASSAAVVEKVDGRSIESRDDIHSNREQRGYEDASSSQERELRSETKIRKL